MIRFLSVVGMFCQALLLTLAFCVGRVQAQSEPQLLSIEPAKGIRSVVFLAHDLASGESYVLNADALDVRHPPFSTFKIPNFLILLEHGVIDSPQTVVVWDPERRPVREWWPAGWQGSQDLVTAFRRSTVWVFQDLAQELGGERYREVLADWEYGNAQVIGESDDFWLDGTLLISPREQVGFMQRLVSDDLGVKAANLDAFWTASRQLESAHGVLHAKTGAGPLRNGDMDGPFAGWYVGAVRRQHEPPVVFALYTEADSYTALSRYRAEATLELLGQVGLWEVSGQEVR